MNNADQMLQQIGKELDLTRLTLREIDARLQGVMRALNEIEKKAERSSDSRDIIQSLGEVARQVNATSMALTDTGHRYTNVERVFLEVGRAIGKG